MTPFVSELVGTGVLILLGNGVVANVVLSKTFGNNGGWIVITFGWAIAVFVGVYISAAASGAHLNPAITISLAFKNGDWSNVPVYIAGQMLGGMLGSTLVWAHYRQHYDATEDAAAQLATFCNAPAINSVFYNLLSEIIGTFVLVFGVLFISKPHDTLGSLDALPVALLVLGIGLSLGGSTGYAINPARDLAPRIMHWILPMKGKRPSNWRYSWIPVVGPIIGGLVAVLVFNFVQ
ncbi:MAG: MIP/aquaporin family protein [Ferruginibacter sp.]